MAALTADRDTRELASSFSMPFEEGVAASSLIYQGALVVKDASGFVAPGSTATGLVAMGVAQAQADNSSGANDDINVKVRSGIFLFVNDGGTPVAQGDEGSDCYILDDQTVTGDATGRSVAGKVLDHDYDGGGLVAVAVGYLLNV